MEASTNRVLVILLPDAGSVPAISIADRLRLLTPPRASFDESVTR